ncbi:hypothetical protein NC651_035541 [Populus alba x Populus x berolinensis]|nr:hypothetical protein NC651_035541 [Populus alba x Populus x berolinensis]
MSLRPFLPELQTTFIKCLQDSTRTVRTSPAFALGKLSALSTRVDPLVSDLLSSLQASDASVREAILTPLKGIHPSLTLLGLLSGIVPRALKFQMTLQYMEEPQLDDLLELLSNLASSPSWVSRHGSVLTISSLLRHNPSSVVTSQMFPSIIHCLKDALKDEKFPLHELQRRRRLILHQIQSDPTEATAYVDIISIIVSALHDDSNEVRRRGLFALKAIAKGSPPSITVHVSIIGLALAKGLKDSSTPVQTLFKLLKNLLQALLGDFQSSLNIGNLVEHSVLFWDLGPFELHLYKETKIDFVLKHIKRINTDEEIIMTQSMGPGIK